MPGEFVDVGLERYELFAEFGGHGFEDHRIDFDACKLNLRNDRDEGAFDILVNGSHFFQREAGFEDFMQAQGDFRILGGVVQRFFDRHLVEGDLGFAFAGDLFIFDRRVADMQDGEIVHGVRMGRAIQHVGEQHRIVARGNADVVFGKDLPVIFHVMGDFEDGLIFEDGFEEF